MLNFDFKNPVKILFGKGQIEQIKNEIPAGSKVLITYGGGSIKKNGVYDEVRSALQDFTVFEFGGIPANPEYEVLIKAHQLIKEKGIDFVLAVGGGSVIDGTKFLSGAAVYDGEPWDILAKGIRTEKGLPFGTVLTMPATGSEMNSGAVITRAETKEKRVMGGPGLFPQFSVLDPKVVATIPRRQLQNGIIDSFVHVLEQYLTYVHPAKLQDRFAESILQTIVETAPKILENPADYDTAANYMWCCTMALNGLIQKGVPTDWATHMIGHELTALHNIDHARTLAIIGPQVYRFQFEHKKEKLAQYGQRVWGINADSVDAAANMAIDKTVEFYKSLGVAVKLSDYTAEYSGTAEIVQERFTERGWNELSEQKNIGPAQAKQIVESSIN